MQRLSPSNRAPAVFLAGVSALVLLASSPRGHGAAPASWTKVVELTPTASEPALMDQLKQNGLEVGQYVNWYAGRFPSISFIGGQCNGNRSEDLEFFFEKPFHYYNQVLDFVMEQGGNVYGIRARVRRIKEGARLVPFRSFLLQVRCDELLQEYHPSYILVNGRRVWDSRKHPWQKGKILVPFSLAEAADPVIDFVIDRQYTPELKGLAFRMFFLLYLGQPGTKVNLKGAPDSPEESPANKLERFAFGLFPSDWDFWSESGTPFAEIQKSWKPNFRPAYPVDELWLSPFVFDSPAKGKYHDFMLTYGGCNLLANRPDPAQIKAAPAVRGALTSMKNPAETRAILDAGLEAHWFLGEYGTLAGTSESAHRAAMERGRQAIEQAKRATGHPEKVTAIFEPFSPALWCAHEYERGHDILVLKNEEDPQYNIMMAMARGAGRTFGKPFGFYWEQTHYPDPSTDFKLHACLLYYFSGGSWLGGEAENYPAFERERVPERALPYVQALRFAMAHPARGTQIVPVGILWGLGDKWIVPYNPFGHLDTFVRCWDYDHATKTLTTEPNFTHTHPWWPTNRARWNFNTTGHGGYLFDAVPELKGYDLLDVFFPQFGDAFTCHIARLLTGTPHGPLDFVYLNQASVEHLKSFGMLAILGHAILQPEIEKKLTEVVSNGVPLVFGAQHLMLSRATSRPAFGLTLIPKELSAAEGPVTGLPQYYPSSPGRYSGRIYGFKGDGWETVASAGDRPLVIRKQLGRGQVIVYLGEWIHAGGAALRPILGALATAAAPLQFSKPSDSLEYVSWRKGAGAWVAVFNHGGIAIGCDRLKQLRAKPPEPLVSEIKGPWQGELTFRLERLGLDPKAPWAVYEVEGLDEPAFARIIAGTSPFVLRELPSRQSEGNLTVSTRIAKRAEYVLAPKGQGEKVFFGPR